MSWKTDIFSKRHVHGLNILTWEISPHLFWQPAVWPKKPVTTALICIISWTNYGYLNEIILTKKFLLKIRGTLFFSEISKSFLRKCPVYVKIYFILILIFVRVVPDTDLARYPARPDTGYLPGYPAK